MKQASRAPARRLNLKGLYNARDLGGYHAMDGKVTKFGVFVRCEVPHGLPEEDIQYLRDYGVTATVDFRGGFEIEKQKSDLADVFTYYHRSAFDMGPPPDFDKIDFTKISMLDQYKDMVETGKEWIKGVLELAANEEGVLLYHCAAGKDRTGVMSCMLLSVAGVSREDIAADYCISEVLLRPVTERVFQNPPSGDSPFGKDKPMPKMDMSEMNKTPASTMLGLLDYIDEKYGSVMGYLADIGVTDETIAKIRDKFLVDA